MAPLGDDGEVACAAVFGEGEAAGEVGGQLGFAAVGGDAVGGEGEGGAQRAVLDLDARFRRQGLCKV